MSVQFFSENIWLKVLSVAIAFGFWVVVAGEPVVERGLEVPLGFENIPGALQVAGEPPDTVRIRVRGSQRIINGLVPDDVVAVLDLAGERSGDRRLFDMYADRVRVPFGVEVTQISPATITISIDRAGVPESVIVVPDIEGRPAEGFAIGRISVLPAEVNVVGPDSILAALSEALTEPITIEGASGRVQQIVTVGVSDPSVRLQTPTSAEVTVEIVPAPLERTFDDLSVTARELATNRRVTIEPDTVSVGIRGGRGEVAELDPTLLNTFVHVAELQPGRYNLPVTVELTEGLGVTDIEPSRVTVTIQ